MLFGLVTTYNNNKDYSFMRLRREKKKRGKLKPKLYVTLFMGSLDSISRIKLYNKLNRVWD